MSAVTPIQLALASFAVQTYGTMQQIKQQKKATQAEVKQYEEEKKYNKLKALQDANDVLEESIKKQKINRSIQAGLGYNDTSRSFLSTQSEIRRIAKKDVTNIQINAARGGEKLESAIYTTKVMGKSKVYGGYANIVSAGIETTSYIKSRKPKGQYDVN